MFTKTIDATRICASELDKVFSNIRCGTYHADYALMTLARVLLGERVHEEVVTFTHDFSIPFEEAAADHTVSICAAKSKGEFDTYAAKAKEARYEKNERFDSYFRSFQFGLWSNPAKKSTVILYESGGMQIYHNILSAFKWFVPWYFAGEQGLAPSEVAMLKTFTEPHGEAEFVHLANEYYKQRDYREQILCSQLDGVEKLYRTNEAAKLLSKINQRRNEIEEYQRRINENLQAMRKFEIRRLGLLAEEAQKDNRILNMFLHYKNLYLDHVNDKKIRYIVRTKATNIDGDMYRHCTRSKESYIYERAGVEYELAKRVLDAIFLEKQYALYLFGAYELHFGGSFSLCGHTETSEVSSIALPNPHVFYHECAGSFAADLSSAMMEGDLEEAIEVTIAETANINFGDSVPVEGFARDFFIERKDTKCIETSEGEMISPVELIGRIEKEMEHETAETHTED